MTPKLDLFTNINTFCFSILKKVFQIFLYPFSLIYGAILYLRNKLYDLNLLKSVEFDFPIISVGNLNLGGVGKTPHVEYLVNLLHTKFKVATLSRGYKRKTKGFALSNQKSTAEDIGDEPLQYRYKFKNIPVAVDEDRVHGITFLKKDNIDINVIILDDAYQHRKVKPGINILITDYSKLFIDDCVVPSGRLREWRIGYQRADIIIVSKCPEILSPIDKRRIKEDINPKPYQEIYFSYIKYKEIIPYTKVAKKINISSMQNCDILLITGIAKPSPLFYNLKIKCKSIKHLQYNDHHNFSFEDIENIKSTYNNMYGNNKLIITTEKDLMRLSLPTIKEKIELLPIFYIPIEVEFHDNDKKEFNLKILKYVTANTRN